MYSTYLVAGMKKNRISVWGFWGSILYVLSPPFFSFFQMHRREKKKKKRIDSFQEYSSLCFFALMAFFLSFEPPSKVPIRYIDRLVLYTLRIDS